MIVQCREFNVSILTKETDFSLIKRFGFSSGKDTNKFENFENAQRSENGIFYITESTNAFITGKVVNAIDLGTHTTFIADVVEAKVLGSAESLTYRYYLNNIKPQPHQSAEKKKGYVCKICGFVYEGETLPPDYICPICKHGVEAFEKIQ
jgi:flavin reductase (DIM6/NTAB) family NADH-FMN oxidoreductase RutF